jgi:E3 ubiquitin-protein ligase RNF11
MGNCLKAVSSSDDISLLRESPSRPDHSDGMSDQPPAYQETADPPHHHLTAVRRVAAQLSEEEQVRMAQRMGLIQHLPTGAYDGSKKNPECVICMNDFMVGETIRFLPCMHVSPCLMSHLMSHSSCW